MQVLVLNAGSSSLKFAVMAPQGGEPALSGLAERLGTAQASIRLDRGGERVTEALAGGSHREAVARVLKELETLGLRAQVAAVGHRVVHGGELFAAPARITPEVLAAIRACVPLAPLHNPANLAGIVAAQEAFPELLQVAVFDTAFHQTLPPVAYRYAVPEEWYEKRRVRRYGFHGTSHQFVAQEAVQRLNLDPAQHGLITAHLGNGASVAAVRDGRSVDTSMGLTPLEGLVMGTRSGNVDPGLVAFMVREAGLSVEEVTDALNTRSGLKGLSGLTNDMRELEAAAAGGHAGAQLALDVFVYRLAQTMASYVVSLDRLDALVFTGGIGENSVGVRARVMARLHGLGLVPDPAANAALSGGRSGVVSAPESRVTVLVIGTNEELMIARQTAEITQGGAA